MKVLITGITGFLGRHLAERLSALGHSVYGTARKDADTSFVLPFADIVHTDFLDREFIFNCVKDKDVVVHLAAVTAHDKLVNEAEKSTEFNLLSTTSVLDAVKQSSNCHFIFPSSGKVYGRPEKLPYTETHPARPSNILGRLKLKIEQRIKAYAKADKHSNIYTIMRIFNVYGPYQKETFFIPTIIKQAVTEGKSEIVLGDIKARRDYIFVDDVVDAFIDVIKNKEKLYTFEILNVGSGKSYSAEEIVQMVSELLGKKIKFSIDKKKLRHDEFDEERAGISKLSQFGWKPKTDIKEGLKQLLS